jgi:hypothetical protein
MSQWRLLPVLDVSSLAESKLKELAQAFDQFSDAQLVRIPQQYGARGEIDPLRLEIDQAFLRIMGIKSEKEDLLDLYKEIAQSLVQWVGP